MFEGQQSTNGPTQIKPYYTPVCKIGDKENNKFIVNNKSTTKSANSKTHAYKHIGYLFVSMLMRDSDLDSDLGPLGNLTAVSLLSS